MPCLHIVEHQLLSQFLKKDPTEVNQPTTIHDHTPTNTMIETAVVVAAIFIAFGMARQAGSINYKKDEVDLLLDLVEHIQPAGPADWDQITEEYNSTIEARNNGDTTRNRDAKALKYKFKKLVNAKPNTGDPNCPPDVRRAKRIQRDIIQASGAATGGTTDSEAEQEEWAHYQRQRQVDEEQDLEEEMPPLPGQASTGASTATSTSAAAAAFCGNCRTQGQLSWCDAQGVFLCENCGVDHSSGAVRATANANPPNHAGSTANTSASTSRATTTSTTSPNASTPGAVTWRRNEQGEMVARVSNPTSGIREAAARIAGRSQSGAAVASAGRSDASSSTSGSGGRGRRSPLFGPFSQKRSKNNDDQGSILETFQINMMMRMEADAQRERERQAERERREAERERQRAEEAERRRQEEQRQNMFMMFMMQGLQSFMNRGSDAAGMAAAGPPGVMGMMPMGVGAPPMGVGAPPLVVLVPATAAQRSPAQRSPISRRRMSRRQMNESNKL